MVSVMHVRAGTVTISYLPEKSTSNGLHGLQVQVQVGEKVTTAHLSNAHKSGRCN